MAKRCGLEPVRRNVVDNRHRDQGNPRDKFDSGDGEKKEQKRRNKSLSEWQDLINKRLEEAMERGDFDNLPGQGKPLDLTRDPNEPAEMRMANKLLKDNDLTPPWIADRNQILAEVEMLRTEIEQTWAWYAKEYRTAALNVQREALNQRWQRALEAWEGRIVDLNRRILEVNLTLPIWRLEVLRLNLDRELAKIGANRRLDD